MRTERQEQRKEANRKANRRQERGDNPSPDTVNRPAKGTFMTPLLVLSLPERLYLAFRLEPESQKVPALSPGRGNTSRFFVGPAMGHRRTRTAWIRPMDHRLCKTLTKKR